VDLGWRRTWEDSELDYVFCDGAQNLGRVYIHGTGGLWNGKWRWFFAASSGIAESRREAMLAVEDAYERRATRAT
jgi:hypothetical protein